MVTLIQCGRPDKVVRELVDAVPDYRVEICLPGPDSLTGKPMARVRRVVGGTPNKYERREALRAARVAMPESPEVA